MKTMTCKAAQAQLVDYVEGELDQARRPALQEHVATCPHCRRELQEIERVRGALGRERVPDPGAAFWEKFPDQVWQAYRNELSARPRHGLAARGGEMLARIRFVLAPRLWVPAAAVVVLVVGLALFFALETPNSPGIAAFQARIQGGKNLVPLAQRSLLELPADHRYGFSAAPGKVNFFRIGHGYAESLAYAAGGDAETARKRLAAIAGSLGAVGGDLAGLTQGSPSPRQIAALEPELARIAEGARQAALFRAGGWLVNLALAVAARDRAALQDAAPEILRLRRDLESGGVAPGALRDLSTLARLLARDSFSDREYAEAARLIREVQLVLI